MPQHPPMNPGTDEASQEQLRLAQEQGEAYGRAVRHMVTTVAQGGAEQDAGHYRVGYAVEKAEGMHHWTGDGLEWREPGDENIHVEVTVRDGSDGRFVPGLTVRVTLVDGDGNEVGTHEQPFLWHPMLYHYGRNWKVPGDGEYTIRVRVEPPTFMRHDRENGRRYTEPVEVEFAGVKLVTGQG